MPLTPIAAPPPLARTFGQPRAKLPPAVIALETSSFSAPIRALTMRMRKHRSSVEGAIWAELDRAEAAVRYEAQHLHVLGSSVDLGELAAAEEGLQSRLTVRGMDGPQAAEGL